MQQKTIPPSFQSPSSWAENKDSDDILQLKLHKSKQKDLLMNMQSETDKGTIHSQNTESSKDLASYQDEDSERKQFFERAPFLEDGNESNQEKSISHSADDNWPLFSSIIKNLSLDSKPSFISFTDTNNEAYVLPTQEKSQEKCNQESNYEIKTTKNFRSESLNESPYLPYYDDPLHFLMNQESFLLQKLPQLSQIHEDNLKNGNKNLNVTRKDIIALLFQLNQGYQAMKDIYNSEKFKKLSKLQNFNDWEKRKKKIQNKIDIINNTSEEGQNYQKLLSHTCKIDNEIEELEMRLSNLKSQRKLIKEQILETKSLLDIKLNVYKDSLEQLELTENNEISNLHKEKLLPDESLSGPDIVKNLYLQIHALDDFIDETSLKELNFDKCLTYVSDIFENSLKMEKSMKIFIKEGKQDLIIQSLITNREYLMERLNQIDKLKLKPIRGLLVNELNTIIEALELFGVETNEHSRISEVDDALIDDVTNDKTKDNSPFFPIISPSHAAPITSTDISSHATSPSGEMNKVTGKPNIFPTKKSNKYDNLLTKIKKSKGDKTD